MTADSATSSLRVRKQGAGNNVNLWGDLLDTALDLIDDAIAGVTSLVVTGDHALTATNFVTDEARRAVIKLTGSPTANFTITIPSTSKVYHAWNATPQIATFSTGSGVAAQVRGSEIVTLICDGTNVVRVQGFYFSNQRLQGVSDPANPQDAATKAYVDATAFGLNTGILPGQPGNNGSFLTTNGTTASWAPISAAAIGAVGSNAPVITGGMTQTGSTKFTTVPITGVNVDFSASDTQSASISANTTFTYSGFTGSQAQSVTFWLTISAGAIPAWPAVTRYGGGSQPTLGNGKHMLHLSTPNGGADVILTVAAKNWS